MVKTIHTNEFLNDQVWRNMIVKYGQNRPNLIKNHPVNQHEKKVYCQTGEDGILEYILNKIGMKSKVCVEFGAMDGVRISNTLNLKKNYGFRRILIEGNPIYTNKTDGEEIINSVITPENINELLERGNCPDKYDLLSIDIDGDDYWVLKAIKKTARVIILEYHCAIPNEQCLTIKPGTGSVRSHLNEVKRLNAYYGANLRAFYRMVTAKGYEFVTTLKDNAIFVLAEDFPKLDLPHISEDECIDKFFYPSDYWWQYRDQFNKEWLIVDSD